MFRLPTVCIPRVALTTSTQVINQDTNLNHVTTSNLSKKKKENNSRNQSLSCSFLIETILSSLKDCFLSDSVCTFTGKVQFR